MTADHYRKLENMMHDAPFMKLTGTRVKIDAGKAEIYLSVRPDFFHAAGALHGSLYFLALDNAAFFAVNSVVTDVFVYTTSFTTYITRPVSEGIIRAEGRIANKNNSQFIGESVLYNSENQEIARANGIFVRSKVRLTPEIGYK